MNHRQREWAAALAKRQAYLRQRIAEKTAAGNWAHVSYDTREADALVFALDCIGAADYAGLAVGLFGGPMARVTPPATAAETEEANGTEIHR